MDKITEYNQISLIKDASRAIDALDYKLDKLKERLNLEGKYKGVLKRFVSHIEATCGMLKLEENILTLEDIEIILKISNEE